MFDEVELPDSRIRILPQNWRASSEDQSLLSPDMAAVDPLLYVAMCSLIGSKPLCSIVDLDEEIPFCENHTDSVAWLPPQLTQKRVTMAPGCGTSG